MLELTIPLHTRIILLLKKKKAQNNAALHFSHQLSSKDHKSFLLSKQHFSKLISTSWVSFFITILPLQKVKSDLFKVTQAVKPKPHSKIQTIILLSKFSQPHMVGKERQTGYNFFQFSGQSFPFKCYNSGATWAKKLPNIKWTTFRLSLPECCTNPGSQKDDWQTFKAMSNQSPSICHFWYGVRGKWNSLHLRESEFGFK